MEQEGSAVKQGETIATLRSASADLDRSGPRRERKEMAAFLRDEVTEILKRLEGGRIDLGKVEEGIHELRRKLRWIPTYGLAAGGKIILDP